MKTKIMVIAGLLVFQSAQAQIDFDEHSIDNTSCIDEVYPADIDGDGDMDFFATCFFENERHITWFENSDGRGSFVQKEEMLSNQEAPTRLFPCDLDGDGDLDLLSASQGVQGSEKKLFWYKNRDGQGNFDTRQIIEVSDFTPWSISANDLDGDGDLDVVASYPADGKVVWFENTNGNGTFGDEQIITSTAPLAWGVYVADMDGDDDMDVLTASEGDNDIAWYENTDGMGNFGAKQIISTQVNIPTRVYAADLDNDGDQDVVSSSYNDGKVAWYENTNGLGNFSNQNVILRNETGVADLAINDIDRDGDLDIFSTSRFNATTKVAWYENTDGLGDFGAQQVITTELSNPESIHAVDIDRDFDTDIIFSSGFSFSNAATTYWYENITTVSVREYTLTDFTISPNLARDFITIESATEIVSIEIYNTLGQLFLKEAYPTVVDLSALNEGWYFCVVKDTRNNFGIKKIFKSH